MGHSDYRALRGERSLFRLPLAEHVDRVPRRPERFVQLAVEGDRGVDIDRPDGGALSRRATAQGRDAEERESQAPECGQTAPFRSSPTSPAARIKTGSGIFLGTSRNASVASPMRIVGMSMSDRRPRITAAPAIAPVAAAVTPSTNAFTRRFFATRLKCGATRTTTTYTGKNTPTAASTAPGSPATR